MRQNNSCPILFDNLNSLWPGTIECISPTAIFNDLLLKNCCSQRQTLRHCVWIIGCFCYGCEGPNEVSASFSRNFFFRQDRNDHSPLSGVGSYHMMCLGFNPEQLSPGAFRLPKQKKNRHVNDLPRYHQDVRDRIPWLKASHRWKVFNAVLTAPRRPAGEMLQFCMITLSNSSAVLWFCDQRHPAFLGATSCSIKTGEQINFLIPRGERVRILCDQARCTCCPWRRSRQKKH